MSIGNEIIVLRLALAILVGMTLGIERECSRKPAGLRTHMIVCMSGCIVALISAYGFVGLGTQNDPARLVVGAFTGLGFLGAGIIWRDGDGVVGGITTAAEIFQLSIIGMACGLGLYFLAVASVVLTFMILSTQRLIRKFIRKQ